MPENLPADHNRLDARGEALAMAKARHQEAVAEAYRVFNTRHSEAVHRHRETYIAARDAWKTVKNTPEAGRYEELRQAFLEANRTPDHSAARTELDKAIRAADAAYEAAIARAE